MSHQNWEDRMWNQWAHQRNLLASLSDSSKVRMSPSLTGPLTFLIMNRFWSSRNLTLTWVTWPLDPVRPITFTTTACFTWDSILCTGKKYYQLKKKKKFTQKQTWKYTNIYANYWQKNCFKDLGIQSPAKT